MAAKEKKGFHFESLSVLSIFCHKNEVFSKKKVLTLNLSLILVFAISKGGGMAQCPHPKYATGCNLIQTSVILNYV